MVKGFKRLGLALPLLAACGLAHGQVVVPTPCLPPPGCVTPQPQVQPLPSTDPQPQPQPQPQAEAPMPEPDVVAPSSLAAAGETGTGAASQYAPDLVGDFFAGSRYQMNGPGLGQGQDTPSPLGGELGGRTKFAEANNPMPRDRLFLNIDYYNETALTQNGTVVRRYSPGAEKTFFDGRMSVEARVPFASTFDPNIVTGGQTASDTTLGNVNVAVKGLLYSCDNMHISSGLSVSLPTADDVSIRVGRRNLAVVENESVLLSPYAAVLFTPNERFFAQVWGAYMFDPNGSPVLFNEGGFLLQRGRLQAQDILLLDLQIGYWMVRNCDGWLRGVAPLLELHYNTGVSSMDAVGDQTFGYADVGGSMRDLTLTAAVITQLGDSWNMTIGGVVPLLTGNDRFFDYQVGIRLNYLFGASRRNADAQISSF